MDPEKRSLRIGTVAVLFALVFRFLSTSPLTQWLARPEVASALIFMETGRLVSIPDPQPVPEQTQPAATEPKAEDPTQSAAQAVFSPDDSDLVSIQNSPGHPVDVEALLQQPLSWDLTQDGPAVLILHSHGTESYTKTEDYTESSAYRTLDVNYNVVSVGSQIAAILERGGIGVIHDTTLHDYPSYNDAYTHARESIRQYLAQYPSIRLVLDIHRDSSADSSGTQYAATVTAGSREAARLMLVMGSDAGGQSHPNWQENLSLAVKLQAVLEKETPGICRDIILRSSRYNQDLSPGALLIEVGAAGNTRQEALLAGQLLAEGILSLAYGTVA